MYKIFLGDLSSDELNVISPNKTPYDLYYKAGMRECLRDIYEWWHYINGIHVSSSSKARFEIITAITFNKLQQKIRVSKEAIDFLWEDALESTHGFEGRIDTFVRYILDMDPELEYRECNRCGNTLVITGHRSMHYSTTKYFFCLDCAASYMTYEDSKKSYCRRIPSPDFTLTIE